MYIDKMKPDDDLVAKTEKFVHHAETSRPKDHVLGKRPVEVIYHLCFALSIVLYFILNQLVILCAIGKPTL